MVSAQLRLEERNSAETRNSALAQARRLLVEHLACSGLDGGHEGQNVGLKEHSLVCCCELHFYFFILKTFKVKDDDFFLSLPQDTQYGGQIRCLAGLEKITPYTRAPGSHYSMKISATPLDGSIPFPLPKTGLWLESKVSAVTL